ncbi:hypothetical protein FQN57_002141 [Myotisia sp. PD_48]|nr:hypothetical protein FQN57_002141 [Myotisia sp. PD_48]
MSLPNELLLWIDSMIDSWQALNSLARCNKRLYTILNPLLYQQDAQFGQCEALFWAADTGSIKTAQLSLDSGADINTQRDRYPYLARTPIFQAVTRWCELGKVLKGPEPTPELAEKYDHFIRFLLSRGADLNLVTKPRMNFCLSYACRYYPDLEVFRMLLENGADPNLPVDAWGGTIVHELVRLLAGTDPNHPNEFLEMLRLSLEHGGDPNARNKRQVTPLHVATNLWRPSREDGGFAVVERAQLLIEHGADVNAKNYRGQLPLTLVVLYKSPPLHKELVKILVKNGTDTSLCSSPRRREDQEKLLRICDEISESTGLKYEFIPFD